MYFYKKVYLWKKYFLKLGKKIYFMEKNLYKMCLQYFDTISQNPT
jgi:hypothetical protein